MADKRNVWTHDETVVALGLYFKISFSKCRKFLGIRQFTRLFRWFSFPSGSLVFLRPLLRAFFEKKQSGLSTARLIPFG